MSNIAFILSTTQCHRRSDFIATPSFTSQGRSSGVKWTTKTGTVALGMGTGKAGMKRRTVYDHLAEGRGGGGGGNCQLQKVEKQDTGENKNEKRKAEKELRIKRMKSELGEKQEANTQGGN